jgi:hypothetical protein
MLQTCSVVGASGVALMVIRIASVAVWLQEQVALTYWAFIVDCSRSSVYLAHEMRWSAVVRFLCLSLSLLLPADAATNPCNGFSDCISCLAASCGFCPTTGVGICQNGTATGPSATGVTCTAQWTYGAGAVCPTCTNNYVCQACSPDARCAWCGSRGTCVASVDYHPSVPDPRSYDGAVCPDATLWTDSTCPGTGNPSGPDSNPLTSSTSTASQFATACVVLLCLGGALMLLLTVCRRHWLPVLGKAIGAPSVSSQVASSAEFSSTSAPISLDSSQNPAVKVLIFVLLLVDFILVLIALVTNTYSRTSVSDATRIALNAQNAMPGDSITAGVTGLSGLNPLGGSGGASYNCAGRQNNTGTIWQYIVVHPHMLTLTVACFLC